VFARYRLLEVVSRCESHAKRYVVAPETRAASTIADGNVEGARSKRS
jgi:hypothetical protein